MTSLWQCWLLRERPATAPSPRRASARLAAQVARTTALEGCHGAGGHCSGQQVRRKGTMQTTYLRAHLLLLPANAWSTACNLLGGGAACQNDCGDLLQQRVEAAAARKPAARIGEVAFLSALRRLTSRHSRRVLCVLPLSLQIQHSVAANSMRVMGETVAQKGDPAGLARLFASSPAHLPP